jgi:hypothetical protein
MFATPIKKIEEAEEFSEGEEVQEIEDGPPAEELNFLRFKSQYRLKL